LPTPTAYGEYNDQVLEVAGQRGQTVVTWDFEYVVFLLLLFITFVIDNSLHSSGDSVGATVAESNQRYDDVTKDHPNTLLTLNHEVHGRLSFPSRRKVALLTLASLLETTVYAHFFCFKYLAIGSLLTFP